MESPFKMLGEVVARRLVGYGSALLMAHGLTLSDSTQGLLIQCGVAALGMATDFGWSMYDKYGRRWLEARLEVFAKTAELQQETLQREGLPAPSPTEVAAAIPDPKITPTVVVQATNGK